MVDSVSYDLGSPVLDSFSMVQVGDSLVRISFLARDSTEDRVRITGKLITYLQPGNIRQERTLPTEAVSPSHFLLTGDTIVKSGVNGWEVQTAYLLLDSDTLNSILRSAGTDTTVLRLKIELSDLVPTAEIDTFYID